MNARPSEARVSCSLAFAAGATTIIGLSGLAKFADLRTFAEDLSTWSLLRPSIRAVALTAVPLVEVLLAGLWLIRVRRRLITGLLIAWITLLTGAFGVQAITVGPPSCGCLGVLSRSASELESWPFLLTRNLVLLACLVPYAMPSRWGPRGRPCERAAPRAHRVFTLIEMVCVIAVVGLVASLIAPSLAHVRHRSRCAHSLANLRVHVANMNAYANQYREIWPYFTDPLATTSVIRDPLTQRGIEVVYFGAWGTWAWAMADFYDGDTRHPSLRQPFVPLLAGRSNLSYLYPCVFLASPEFWNARTREVPPAQLRSTRSGDVRWPSLKSLVIGMVSPSNASTYSGTREGGFVDGHAEAVPEGKVVAGYPTNEGFARYTDHLFTLKPPMMHTMSGVRGFDRKD